MTSTLHDLSGSNSGKSPLGQLLVDAGLLSAADLEEVLAEQRLTGEPLGRMLVDGGYVPAHSVAMALAEQHGGLLKTEYGFATGRSSRLEAARPIEPGQLPTPPLDAAPAKPVGGLRVATREPVRAAQPAVVELPAVAAQPPAVEPPAAIEVTAGLEPTAPVEIPVASEPPAPSELPVAFEQPVPVEPAVALEPPVAVESALPVELHAAPDPRLAELEALLARAEAERDAASGAAAAAARRAASLEARDDLQGAAFASLRAGLDDALARLRTVQTAPVAPPPPAPPADHHLCFLPAPGGYSLVERPGPAPEVGAEIEAPSGARFKVLRVGPSPRPGESAPCAFLERIEPA